jgi:hypothetical protein
MFELKKVTTFLPLCDITSPPPAIFGKGWIQSIWINYPESPMKSFDQDCQRRLDLQPGSIFINTGSPGCSMDMRPCLKTERKTTRQKGHTIHFDLLKTRLGLSIRPTTSSRRRENELACQIDSPRRGLTYAAIYAQYHAS